MSFYILLDRGRFQACLRKVIIFLSVTAGFAIVFTTGACSEGKCSASSRFVIGENMADGYALLGHVFENVSVMGVLNCYIICQPNCRCISFNFLTAVHQDNCQLNEENRHLKPSALKPLEGSQYYDLVVDYKVKVRLKFARAYISLKTIYRYVRPKGIFLRRFGRVIEHRHGHSFS